jgi:hypothetical protein
MIRTAPVERATPALMHRVTEPRSCPPVRRTSTLRAAVVAFAGLLRADGPVDLPLLVLPGLAEHGQRPRSSHQQYAM